MAHMADCPGCPVFFPQTDGRISHRSQPVCQELKAPEEPEPFWKELGGRDGGGLLDPGEGLQGVGLPDQFFHQVSLRDGAQTHCASPKVICRSIELSNR